MPLLFIAPTVRLLGAVTIGGVKSTTDTLAKSLPVVPAPLVAVKVTIVKPGGNWLGASWLVGKVPSVASMAVALLRNAAMMGSVAGVPLLSKAGTKMLPGAVTWGKVTEKNTPTVVMEEPVFPALSVAVKVTVVSP